jgi:replicative superfamily II helicase
MVGELAALKAVLDRRRAIFLFPLKALVADKRRHFNSVYGAFGLRTIEATGETDDIGPLLRGQFDVALLTYEKFAAIALATPHVLEQAGVVVVDEVQMLADGGRGVNLEFLLTLILMRRREGIEPQVVALSGVIGDLNGFERWLGARLLRREERPVPLDEGLILASGVYRYLDATTRAEMRSAHAIIRPQFSGKNSSQDIVIPLVQKLVAEGQQVIVFRETKGETRGCAKYLARELMIPPAQSAIDRLPDGDQSQASGELREVLQSGVAFHNADLAPLERSVIEEDFRRKETPLRVLVATTTLAMGVNTPASSVIIVGLDHPGDNAYSVAEYKNLVGRAGRLGFAEKGTSYLVAMDPRSEHDLWHRYVTSAPEDLRSQFLSSDTDPRSLILRVIAAGGRAMSGMTAEQVAEFLELSFGAFQEQSRLSAWKWDHAQLLAAVSNLEKNGLLQQHAAGGFELTPLGRLAGEGGIEVESIVRLVACLRPLAAKEITDPALIAAVQVTRELDQVYFPMNKRSTQKEPQAWLGQLSGQGVSGQILGCLGANASNSYDQALRAKKAVACLYYVSGKEIGEIERAMTQFGGAFDGAAGPIRGVSARTSDLLPTSARVAEILHSDLVLGDRIGRLVVRLTYGLPSSIVDIARYSGNALQRGDYLRLVGEGLVDADAIQAASDDRLLTCLDGDRQRLSAARSAAASVASHRSLGAVGEPLATYVP